MNNTLFPGDSLPDTSPAAVQRHAAVAADLHDDCLALLHSVRRRLTGHEIAMCEAASGQRDDIRTIDMKVIDMLRIQFAFEIGEAKKALKL